MKRTRFIRTTALLLAVMTIFGAFSLTGSAAENVGKTISSSLADLQEALNAASYSAYNKKHPADKGTGVVDVDARDVYSYSDGTTTYYYDAETETFYSLGEGGVKIPADANVLAVQFADFGGKNALLSPATGTLTWQVEIPASGRYGVEILYYPQGLSGGAQGSSSSIERIFYIDGKVPFSQARYLTLSKTWQYGYESILEDANEVVKAALAANGKETDLNGAYLDQNGHPIFRQDINGNQLKPIATTAPQWLTYQFSDANGFYQGAFEFYFDNTGKTGSTHTIALEATREAMAIKSLRIFPVEEQATYADYLEMYRENGYQAVAPNQSIRLEAEAPYRVSDTSVYPANDRTSAINSPSAAAAQLLNVLGGSSYDTIGQWASYRFTVPQDGLYTISLRCKQDKLAGMYTSRAVRLTGGIYGAADAEPTVPFAEAYNARFNYNKSWQLVTLGDGSNVFQFYFEAGEVYTLSLDVSLGTLAEIIEGVEESLGVINDCYLDILKLTGADPDEYRDYRFNRVMPATVRSLLRESKNLYRVSELLTELSGSKGSHVATLDNVARLLETMGTDESKIAVNLDDLKSYIGTLGTWLNNSKRQSLMMDYIVIGGSGNETTYEASFTPVLDGQYRGDANFFEAAGFEITSFFSSFFVDYNNMGVTEREENNKDKTHVEVWLATGRDQASIWRSLADSTFTSQEQNKDLAVDLKLVIAGTLLPSVLAKKGPDVYVGLDSGSVINYAIRSAVLPLDGAVDQPGYEEDLAEVLKSFDDATVAPLVMYDKTYGIPETVMFPMMFYRKDALANLGLDVPQTWDDLLTCVPVLQSANMEIGLARDYNMFLYQRGGDRWSYEGTNYSGEKYADLMSDKKFSTYFDYMNIAYGENVALDAFQYMCRFYTDYSFPVSFDAANRFRTGEMPIVIGEAVSLYNQLTVFATEIRGLWMFTKVPGTVRSDGTVSHISVGAVNAVVLMNGVEDTEAAWRFMKWQTGADVQASYGNSMVALIGPSAKYNTANKDAIAKMSWTTEEYTNLFSQYSELATIPNYPGSYIIQRYLDFAFLNTYNDSLDAVDQLQSYLKTIDKEIARKREEFELPVLEDGATVDDAIASYIVYLNTLSDEELAEFGFNDATLAYLKSQA